MSIPPLAEHYGDAWRYAKSLTPGDSYEDVIKIIPRRFVFRDLHEFADADLPYSKERAEDLKIHPTYVMNINNRYFPFTVPYGFALYFDENKCFIDYACSGL